MIKFAYTILYVEDVVKTMDFYQRAFGFCEKMLAPDNSYGEVESGKTILSFAHKSLAKSNLKNGFIESDLSKQPFGIEIGFTTDNVARTLAGAVAAGALLLEEPKTKPWGQVVAYVRDLDGFLIEICSEMN
ncbi:VOC family protein [Aquirufa lenticrescens]|uniref:VOC family protein n=1 Tax=Aquirufa lenticrescens TaxID=2696560 RepID=UPI001CAA52A3|nr:VOC family protein [Aquirufa lenticrescens]UAJ13388.1 VOC family protein [Aquirufa lenticrescens]